MKDPKIKDVPMLTVDGVEVKVGMKLFVPNVKTKYDAETKKRIKMVEIVEHEVIYANNTTRRIKIRTSEGMESDWNTSGRGFDCLFGKRSTAVRKARTEALVNIKEVRKEISDLNKILNNYKICYENIKVYNHG